MPGFRLGGQEVAEIFPEKLSQTFNHKTRKHEKNLKEDK
jgi:hypothetical protein